jgi:hypothetical protein
MKELQKFMKLVYETQKYAKKYIILIASFKKLAFIKNDNRKKDLKQKFSCL